MTDSNLESGTYEERHRAALDRIKASFAGNVGVSELEEAQAALARAGRENADLQSELDALKAQRIQDLAELDTLIAQLKPLIGDA